MTDDQLKDIVGVEETMQMIQFRELLKSKLTPEEYEQYMNLHKQKIQSIMNSSKLNSLEVAEYLIYQLDSDSTIDEDQKEYWKALIAVSSFEMFEL